MKKTVLAATLVSLSLFSLPAFGVEAHHPEEQGKQQIESQKDSGEITASMQQMKEIREKIETEKNQEMKNKLMHQHMQMMQEGMKMMAMMGQGMMMGQQDTGPMPMEDRMAMMENKMAMMEKMMQGGGMMGGTAGNQEARMDMMEKEMTMMQEIMKGMLMQQQMMMNK
ncbi:MAG: hypothetical protein SCH71_08340 [Desulfobulbaceae bacterium]|nr:hypothetical protein [Desulfobulbaceae bacterium]